MAYNVRHSKRVDHDPATGPERHVNQMREALAWMIGIGLMAVVWWLAKRFLF